MNLTSTSLNTSDDAGDCKVSHTIVSRPAPEITNLKLSKMRYLMHPISYSCHYVFEMGF